MTTSVGKFVNSFPDPIIYPIVGAPTYESLAKFFNKINRNVASVQTNLVGVLATYH